MQLLNIEGPPEDSNVKFVMSHSTVIFRLKACYKFYAETLQSSHNGVAELCLP